MSIKTYACSLQRRALDGRARGWCRCDTSYWLTCALNQSFTLFGIRLNRRIHLVLQIYLWSWKHRRFCSGIVFRSVELGEPFTRRSDRTWRANLRGTHLYYKLISDVLNRCQFAPTEFSEASIFPGINQPGLKEIS